MNKEGLTTIQAERTLKQTGLNEIQENTRETPIKIFLRQIKNNFIIYILTATLILSWLTGKHSTSFVIAGVITLVIAVSFIQEYRAEKAIDSLKKMITQKIIVIRDGKEQEIETKYLVPGDVLLLRLGEKIPADCIILEQKQLKVDESLLTGEAIELTKKEVKQLDKVSDSERIFMGTFVVNGRCTALVEKTGMKTRFGKIASLITKEKKELPLQNKVNKLAEIMSVIAIIVSLIAGGILLSRAEIITQRILLETAIVVIALTVSSFPEGFPVALITTLSAGTYRMAKKNAIVNRMSVIETIGETTVICTDKTGTITKGEMTVKEVFLDNRRIQLEGTGLEGKGRFLEQGTEIIPEKDNVLNMLIKSAISCNDATIEKTSDDHIYKARGNPTEVALLIMAAKAGFHKEDIKGERIEELPFSSQRKKMTVITELNKKRFMFVKGAPEKILNSCSKILRNNGTFTLVQNDKSKLEQLNNSMTNKAYRTLALAYKEISSNIKTVKEEDEQDLTFIGLVAIEDPPREEVKAAIQSCITANIQVKMITGDNKETAESIARQIGLKIKTLTGAELDKLTDNQLYNIVKEITIFARVNPEHKLRIVNALKAQGELVTMTGDGVNDAPALKAAHVGVAMGKNGTDVSRSVADITLKDDNFATIVSAIEEGRTIFSNMRKFLSYQFSCTHAEILIILGGILLGFPLPLLAIQILFMNLVTSDIPAITLGLNPSSSDVMTRAPRKQQNLISKEVFIFMIAIGTVIGILTLGAFYYSYYIAQESLETARTTALVTLILLEIANAFNFRSFRKGSLNRSLFINKFLVYASAISIIATLLIIYTPLKTIFETRVIGMFEWLIILAATIPILALTDLFKTMNNKKTYLKEIAEG